MVNTIFTQIWTGIVNSPGEEGTITWNNPQSGRLRMFWCEVGSDESGATGEITRSWYEDSWNLPAFRRVRCHYKVQGFTNTTFKIYMVTIWP
jgi:hypothetical protein